MFGNTLINRYAKSKTFAKNAVGDAERKRYGDVVELFRRYGDRYDIDHLLMIAQGFQESALDQSRRSHVGAIGVMQIMPATAKDLDVGDVTKTENNIHGGVKYMRFMIDRYYGREPMTPLNRGCSRSPRTTAAPAASRSCARRRRSAGSTRTGGSATSSSSPPTGSGRKRSPTCRTSTSTTPRTSCSRRRKTSASGPAAR